MRNPTRGGGYIAQGTLRANPPAQFTCRKSSIS